MKKTIKRQIVEFVASKGSAGRMEIIEFYIDLKNGSGFYQSNCKRPDILSYSREGIVYHPTKTNNPFRGCLASGFNKIYEERQMDYQSKIGRKDPITKAWLMNGDTKEFLVKGEDGKYQAVIKG